MWHDLSTGQKYTEREEADNCYGPHIEFDEDGLRQMMDLYLAEGDTSPDTEDQIRLFNILDQLRTHSFCYADDLRWMNYLSDYCDRLWVCCDSEDKRLLLVRRTQHIIKNIRPWLDKPVRPYGG